MVEDTGNRVKMGAQVNEALYEEFKEYVQSKTGQKRGVLGEALDAALREYMDKDTKPVEGDVSNEDLLREIQALRRSDDTPAPGPRGTESNDTSGSSVESDASESFSEDTPAPPRGGSVNDLSKDTIGGVPVPKEKPRTNTSPRRRAAWIASDAEDLTGTIPFSMVTDAVEDRYPSLSQKKTRELAWRVTELLAPRNIDSDEVTIEDVKPEDDASLQSRARGDTSTGGHQRTRHYLSPRRSENGAWFKIVSSRSTAALNHQEPTQRGTVYVYLGEAGAENMGVDLGVLDKDTVRSTDSDSDSEGSEEDTDSDGDREDLEAEADADFEELEDADRGREE